MENKIAVLIDAENISYKNAKQIIDTLTVKGDILIKEIVADWTKISRSKAVGHNDNKKIIAREEQIAGWRKEASNYSMTATQQFTYIYGKNTSDIALTIRAMKILYEKPFISVFCLVSNDSDFTRLAQELREHGKEVVGMGEKNHAIQEFINAFTEYVYLDNLLEKDQDVKDVKKPDGKDGQSSKHEEAINAALNEAEAKNNNEESTKKDESKDENKDCILDKIRLDILEGIINQILEEYNGIAHYSLILERMKNQYSDFLPANYGCKSLGQLIDKLMPYLPNFEKSKKKNPNGYHLMLIKKVGKTPR
ncbi:MAG: NYN domain-containing protein [Clostridiales bacterium]|jgi:uncharacterized LabA/DUF88 family protein|nr:NYN domain-containing protein [Clostridiales bacterium]